MDSLRYLLLLYCLMLLVPRPAIGMEMIYKEWKRQHPQEAQTQPNPQEPVQETHAVADRNLCRTMAENFRRQGRRIRLVDIIPSGGRGAILQFICVFEGPDAQTGWFDEGRY